MREYECVGNSISIRVLRMITGMSTCMSMSKSMDVSESNPVHRTTSLSSSTAVLRLVFVCFLAGALSCTHTDAPTQGACCNHCDLIPPTTVEPGDGVVYTHKLKNSAPVHNNTHTH